MAFSSRASSDAHRTNLSIDSDQNIRRQLMKASVLAVLPASFLSACGGTDNDPPAVTLYSSISAGQEGASFALSAVASDDSAIQRVDFLSVTSNSEILLASFTAEPYLLQVVIPAGTAGTTLEYVARAVDDEDEVTDSARVAISVSA
jgi:hypothetical protein